MRAIVLSLTVAGAAILLVPREADMVRALGGSVPRPELEAFLKKRLAESPKDPFLLRELARIRRGRSDPEGERVIRQELGRVSPGDLENLESLLEVLIWENQTAEAYALVRRLETIEPSRRDLHERAVDLALYLGRPNEAVPDAFWLRDRGCRNASLARIFTAAGNAEGLRSVLSDPRDLARALLAIDRQPEAIQSYLEHLDGDPTDVAARQELALVYRWNGKPFDAAAQLEECLRTRDDPAIRGELVDLYRMLGRPDLMLPHLPENLEKAELLVTLGRVEEAIPIFERLGQTERLVDLAMAMRREDVEVTLRERAPRTRENLQRLAHLYEWRKDFPKALALYEELGDDRAVDLRLALGDASGAIETARSLGLHGRAGDLYLSTGNIEKAISEYEQAPEKGAALIGLLVRVGRRDEALGLLEDLELEPLTKAELFAYAGRPDRTLALLRTLPGGDWEEDRIEAIARATEGEPGLLLYRLLLEHSPGDEGYLRSIARIAGQLGKREEAIAAFRELLALHPEDPELLGELGLLLPDRRLLEQALAKGWVDPRAHRMLALIARKERRLDDAIRHLRDYHRVKEDDYETHFWLGELTRDSAEFDRAWALLPPGELRIRARILEHRGDWAQAEALLRQGGDIEGLVDLLLERGRYPEAEALPMTPRQKAILAIGQGRNEDAVRLLKELDLSDPDIRESLAEALLALGHWQEAEEYAKDDLKRDIHGRYGPEGSTQGSYLNDRLQTQLLARIQYRMYLLEPLFVRVSAGSLWARNLSPEPGEAGSITVEDAEFGFHYMLLPKLRAGVEVGGWQSDVTSSVDGCADLEWRDSTLSVFVSGRWAAPWTDSVGTMELGASGPRAGAALSWSPRAWLTLSASGEERWYQASSSSEIGFAQDTATELVAHGRLAVFLYRGQGSVGKYFYDLPLLHDEEIRTHVGLAVQGDFADVRAPADLLSAVLVAPRTEILTVGPTLAWAGSGWGLFAAGGVGADPARNLPFGHLWQGTAGVVLTLSDTCKLGASIDYVNEQTLTIGGASYRATVGLNVNF
jgi:tetratricopeptide (TPR) repeat protein